MQTLKYGSDLEDKIAILNLNENRVSELKRLKLKDLPFDPTDDAIYMIDLQYKCNSRKK